jgi:hydroxymethylpyrimidine pyrophosphatase-like HAD family hydrolase
MITVDLDGTLLNLDARVSARNLAALHAAAQAGIQIVVATGRRHCYALHVLRGIGMPEQTTMITSNGAVVRTLTGKLIERTFMPNETARWLCGHLGEFRNALVITFDKHLPNGEDDKGALVVEELDDLTASIGNWIRANERYLERVAPIEDALDGDPPIQMMLCGTVERMRRAEIRMLEDPRILPVGDSSPNALLTLNRTEYAEKDLSLLDILPAGCSKGNSLLRLAASHGIAPGEIMAIGDNYNDLSMLEVVGNPVLMGNAPLEVQAIALERNWHITATNDADGVAEAIYNALPQLGAELLELPAYSS